MGLKIDITADIIGTLDEEAFTTAVTKYFSELIRKTLFVAKAILKNKGQVTRNQIGSFLIASGGAFDYKNLKLNGLEENIDLGQEDLPVLGEVVLNVAV